MIIDADVHLSPTFEGGNSITYDKILDKRETGGVYTAVTCLQPPYTSEIILANE